MPKGEQRESTSNSHSYQDAQEWITVGGSARHDSAGGDAGRVLQNWISAGTTGAERVRAPVRTHDVSGLGTCAEDAAHQADQLERWRAERIDDVRCNELLRSGAVECARARVVAGSGSDAGVESGR